MFVGDLLPVQDTVPGLASDLHPPGRVPGLLAAIAVHGPDGAVGVLPPLELGRVDVPLPVAEHDGLVAIPGGRDGGVSSPGGTESRECGRRGAWVPLQVLEQCVCVGGGGARTKAGQ